MQEEVGAGSINPSASSSNRGIGGDGGGLVGGDGYSPMGQSGNGATQTEGGLGATNGSFGKGGEGGVANPSHHGIFSGGGRRILWRWFWMERSWRWLWIYSRELPKKLQNTYINTYWKRRM